MNEDNIEATPDLLDTKKYAIRYWERRRWVYLGLLIPPVAVGYFLTGEVLASFDKPFISDLVVLLMFTVGFVNANIAYSFAYVVEFGFLGTSKYDSYSKTWRPLLFAAGCILGIILAFAASRSIAFTKFTPI
ncbi:MAG: hypothetical protein P1V20_20825 [Verrucomicrobiales bacterium]|nr:hypothetical protein [Verrucomicrobiales bacterium]